MATNTFPPSSVAAQDASSTLVIAAPATPQGLDIEFDVSLGSIDSLGALYDYMLAYEKISRSASARRPARGHMRPYRQARQSRAARPSCGRVGDSPDGCKATFKLREGVKSNWGNKFSAEDVKWTWDRKFNSEGPGRSSRPRCSA